MIHQWEDLISGLGLNLIMEVFIAENVLNVKVKDAWIPVRIEMDEDWYLVGLPKTSLSGLTVRM